MIRKILLDIVCAVLVAMIAVLASQRPVVNLNPQISIADKRQPQDAIKKETKKVEKEVVREIVGSKALKERNIFATSGSYTASRAVPKGALPENPYTLVGVLQGEEKKAVFRDYTGSLITLTVGKKLTDGSVITRIDKLSVEVKKGKEKREMTIFDVKTPTPLTVKKP